MQDSQQNLSTILTTDASMSKQVDGTHYLNMGIQPLEVTFLNFGYAGLKASVHTKVIKYITRDKGDEVVNLKKAIHCLEILLEKAKEQ